MLFYFVNKRLKGEINFSESSLFWFFMEYVSICYETIGNVINKW